MLVQGLGKNRDGEGVVGVGKILGVAVVKKGKDRVGLCIQRKEVALVAVAFGLEEAVEVSVHHNCRMCTVVVENEGLKAEK